MLFLFLGICYLVWSTHLSPIFLSAIRLIDRVGKVPKDKLCIQDVGMPDQCVHKFFGLCEIFFEIFIKVVTNITNSIITFIIYFFLILTEML